MAAPILHIVFCDAGAEVLRKALRRAGRDDAVLTALDDLAAGPLHAPRPDIGFWEQALAPDVRPLVWTDRRVARQYAGLLAFVARAGEAPFEVIDLTHAGTAPLPALEPKAVVPLLDRAAPISAEARQDLAQDWAELVAENAPLRIVAGGRLISAPVTVFDEAILDECSPYWMRRALVLVMVINAEGWRGVWNASLPVLEARVDALVAAGLLESGPGPRKKPAPEIRLRTDDRQPD